VTLDTPGTTSGCPGELAALLELVRRDLAPQRGVRRSGTGPSRFRVPGARRRCVVWQDAFPIGSPGMSRDGGISAVPVRHEFTTNRGWIDPASTPRYDVGLALEGARAPALGDEVGGRTGNRLPTNYHAPPRGSSGPFQDRGRRAVALNLQEWINPHQKRWLHRRGSSEPRRWLPIQRGPVCGSGMERVLSHPVSLTAGMLQPRD